VKKVLVTGGSRGIGKATCLLLVQNGYDVIGTSRKPDEFSDLPYPLEKLDITDASSIADLVNRLEKMANYRYPHQ